MLPEITIENFKIDVHEELFDYDITGAYVSDIQISKENKSIIISIDSDSDGNLTAYLPREVLIQKLLMMVTYLLIWLCLISSLWY